MVKVSESSVLMVRLNNYELSSYLSRHFMLIPRCHLNQFYPRVHHYAYIDSIYSSHLSQCYYNENIHRKNSEGLGLELRGQVTYGDIFCHLITRWIKTEDLYEIEITTVFVSLFLSDIL